VVSKSDDFVVLVGPESEEAEEEDGAVCTAVK